MISVTVGCGSCDLFDHILGKLEINAVLVFAATGCCMQIGPKRIITLGNTIAEKPICLLFVPNAGTTTKNILGNVLQHAGWSRLEFPHP
jgi:hypothetical protein